MNFKLKTNRNRSKKLKNNKLDEIEIVVSVSISFSLIWCLLEAFLWDKFQAISESRIAVNAWTPQSPLVTFLTSLAKNSVTLIGSTKHLHYTGHAYVYVKWVESKWSK